MKIHQAGRDHTTGSVECAIALEPRANFDDAAVGNEHVCLALAGCIEHTPAADYQRVNH
jgi:hypothetical protein